MKANKHELRTLRRGGGFWGRGDLGEEEEEEGEETR